MAPDLNDEVFAPTGCTSAVQGRAQCTGELKALGSWQLRRRAPNIHCDVCLSPLTVLLYC